MKQDIKYIIKKIIIGICITLGVFYLKPLIGLADETSFAISRDGNNSFSYQSYTLKNKVFDYTFDDDFISYSSPIKMSFYYYRESNKFDNYIIFRNTKLNTYFVYIAIAPISLYTDSDNYYYIKENLTSTTSYNFTNIIMFSADSDLESKLLSESGQSFSFHEHVINDDLKFYSAFEIQKNSSSSLILNTDYKVVDTNIEDLKINDKNWDVGSSVSIPDNYEKIDLTGYNAVLFYPKDYRKVRSCTNVDNVEDVPKQPGGIGGEDTNVCKYIFGFDGYFLHNFTSALIQLDDNNHVLNELYKSYDTLQYDFYSNPYINKNYGFIFYNRDNIYTSDDGYVELKSNKGYAVIYFDSNLYNYVLIKDINTYNGTSLNFIDDKGNEVNTSVSSDSVKQDDNVDGAIGDASNFFSDFKDNDHGLSSIITSPLDFINQLSNSSCAPLVLPIPYSNNQNITLPCMTSIYENNFGIIYSIYSSVIIGITGYWVCVRIYFLVKGFKDPEDDKIEVLEL